MKFTENEEKMSLPHILIIEDERVLRDTLKDILALQQYRVSEASNGLQGLEVIQQEQPDLILCDIMMPEMDGYEVLEKIRKNAHLRKIPFIYLTAKSEKEDLRNGMGMGADDYITKPFKSRDLLEAIQRRLEKANEVKASLSEKVKETLHQLNLVNSQGKESSIRGIISGLEFLSESGNLLSYEEKEELQGLLLLAAKKLERNIQDQLLIEQLQSDIIALKPLDNSISDFQLVFKNAWKEFKPRWSQRNKDHISIQPARVKMNDTVLNSLLCALLNSVFQNVEADDPIEIHGYRENLHYKIKLASSSPDLAGLYVHPPVEKKSHPQIEGRLIQKIMEYYPLSLQKNRQGQKTELLFQIPLAL